MNFREINKIYDVVIVGGGVVGTALFYVLSKYTDIKKIVIFEKCFEVGQINSNSRNNSQTLHFGDIETNYTLEKAKKVKSAAQMTKRYIENINNEGNIFYPMEGKMVLGVGEEETKILEERFENFKELFPSLKKIYREEIEKLEPLIVKNRSFNQSIIALYSSNVCAVDYGKLSKSFIDNGEKIGGLRSEKFLNTKINRIQFKEDYYEIFAENFSLKSLIVVFAAGAHSLLFAKSLGYGRDYTILPMAGSFYWAPNVLKEKVYTVQNPKLPFAAIHGDPDINELGKTRFGPTARAVPWLEPRNWLTFLDFFKSFGFSFKALIAILNILTDRIILKFLFKNFFYDWPIIGRWLFLQSARKIIPSLKFSDLEYAYGIGGIRPQIVDANQKKLLFGEVKIIGKNIIFNMTPSPGASVCLKNAEDDAKKIIEFFEGRYNLNQAALDKDLH